MLQLFHVRPETVPKPLFLNPELPAFFVMQRNPSLAEDSASKILDFLSVRGTRNYLLSMDETYWNPTSSCSWD